MVLAATGSGADFATRQLMQWLAGVADIDMFRGSFSIQDKLNEKICVTGPRSASCPTAGGYRFSRWRSNCAPLRISADEVDARCRIRKTTTRTNRIRLRPRPIQTTISTAAANSSLISICAAASRSRCGPANRALAVIKPAMSPAGRL